MTAEYQKINDALNRLENGYYAIHDASWCASRIDWAWKFRKITREEKDELCDRTIALFESGMDVLKGW